MNTPFKRSSLILLLTACFFISANAQRDRNAQRGSASREGGSYSNRSGGDVSRQRNVDRSTDFNRNNNGSFDRRSVDNRSNDNRIADRSPVNRDYSNSRGSMPTINDNRDVMRSVSRPTDLQQQRGNRTVVTNNNFRVNNYNDYSRYNRYPSVYNYDRRGGYSFARYNYYAPRRYVYIGAPRYSVRPRTFISISFGGYPYWYDRGCFYGYYDNYYAPVFAPIGIRITVLPIGYYPVYIGPSLYYYYDGIYYRRYQDRSDEYEVVDAPMGAVVKSLPKGATVAVVNGEKFYEFNGTYYKEGANSKNEVVYTVVGKNGNINNSDQPEANTARTPQIGDEITTLPENSRQVTINGETLYLTPDNLYLKAETKSSVTTYKVVGKGENN